MVALRAAAVLAVLLVMSRQCLACGKRPADTTPEWPALCLTCLDRTGERIKPRAHVICTVDSGCSGIVDWLVDDGFIAVVKTDDGPEAWVPVGELVRVTRR